MTLKEGFYYEAELIEMGRDEEGNITADDEAWFDGQTDWNIWVVLRDGDGEHQSEILDLDIPVEFEWTARNIFAHLLARINTANRQHLELD